MIDPLLFGRPVLITGANHGIGAATARAFARKAPRRRSDSSRFALKGNFLERAVHIFIHLGATQTNEYLR